MSTQDTRKLSSTLRSIEVIENKANLIHTEYTTLNNDIDRLQTIFLDDTNTHLQIFFQYLEQLLQSDLKNRKSLLNNKRNYWQFFLHALKESKGLYDTVLYVVNCREVKTSIGRGRLFLRFCLQNHRLGDVIQQSFMMNKIVSQFYHDDCFWTQSVYINRIIQSLYQLNDVQFDLLSTSQYQLDICWPSTESTDIFRPKSLSDSVSRLRTNSISSFLSMDSVSSQSIISTSIPLAMSLSQNLELSLNDGSSAHSLSSVEEYPENTLNYWKERCQQLEVQLQSNHQHLLFNDVEIQCSADKHDEISQTVEEKNISKNESESLKSQNDLLKDEINNLNFQLSTFIIQRTTTENKTKDHEREIVKYQTLLETKDKVFNELQRKFTEQTNHIKSLNKHSVHSNKQEKRIEYLTNDLDKTKQLLENERILIEKERTEHNKIQDQMEASIQEKTLDFEEMKRRLVKAIREKADLFNSIYSYEIKLEEEQSKQCIHEDDVLKCTKCETVFGWTVRKYRCRHCKKIFCYYCSNHWQPGSTPSSHHRLCDFCNDKFVKESLMSNYTMLDDSDNNQQTKNDVDLKFEVRSERLISPEENSSLPTE